MVISQISQLVIGKIFWISIFQFFIPRSHSEVLVQAVMTIAVKCVNQRPEQRTFSVAHVCPHLVLGE